MNKAVIIRDIEDVKTRCLFMYFGMEAQINELNYLNTSSAR